MSDLAADDFERFRALMAKDCRRPVGDGDSRFATGMLRGGWLALPRKRGHPVLETSFPTAFQRLDFRDGDRACLDSAMLARLFEENPVV